LLGEDYAMNEEKFTGKAAIYSKYRPDYQKLYGRSLTGNTGYQVPYLYNVNIYTAGGVLT